MTFNFSFDKGNVSDSNVFLKKIQQQLHEKLLAQEQAYNQLRQTGVEALAIILNIMDTGLRIDDNSSMFHFNLEVHPENKPPFRAETHSAVLDSVRPKFLPGINVYVKYNPDDPTQVALDRSAFEVPRAKVKTCLYCNATQTLQSDQTTCSYCGKPI